MKGPWVTGVLANNVWSLGGTTDRGGTKYNNFLMQPFVNFNMKGGWYVGTSPILTANWLTTGNNAWTIPLGANVGRVIKVGGKLPINLSLGAMATSCIRSLAPPGSCAPRSPRFSSAALRRRPWAGRARRQPNQEEIP